MKLATIIRRLEAQERNIQRRLATLRLEHSSLEFRKALIEEYGPLDEMTPK